MIKFAIIVNIEFGFTSKATKNVLFSFFLNFGIHTGNQPGVYDIWSKEIETFPRSNIILLDK